MVSDLKFLAGSAAALAAIFSNETSIKVSSRRLLMEEDGDGERLYATSSQLPKPKKPKRGIYGLVQDTEYHAYQNEQYKRIFGQMKPSDEHGVDDNEYREPRADNGAYGSPSPESHVQTKPTFEQWAHQNRLGNQQGGLYDLQPRAPEAKPSNAMRNIKVAGAIAFAAGAAGVFLLPEILQAIPADYAIWGPYVFLAIGILFTFAAASLMLKSKFEGHGAGRAALASLTGIALTAGVFIPELLKVTEYDEATTTALKHVSEYAMLAGVILAAALVFFAGHRFMGGRRAFCGASLHTRFMTTGVVVATVGTFALSAPLFESIINSPVVDGTAVQDSFANEMTFAALATIWVGLVFFLVGKWHMPGFQNSWVLNLSAVALVATSAAVVVGSGLQTFGPAELGSQIMTIGGISFAAVVVLMSLIYAFSNNPVRCGKQGALFGGDEE